MEIDDLFADPEVVNELQNKTPNIPTTTPETETSPFQ